MYSTQDIAALETPHKVKHLQTTPHETPIDQLTTIQQNQALVEKTSSFSVPKKTYAKPKQSYAESELVTKKSLERGSPL